MKTLTWTTVHNQAEETMTHSFDNNVSCVFKWLDKENNKRESITIVCDGIVVDVFDLEAKDNNGNPCATPMPQYADMLLRIAEISREKFGKPEKLKQIRYHV